MNLKQISDKNQERERDMTCNDSSINIKNYDDFNVEINPIVGKL